MANQNPPSFKRSFLYLFQSSGFTKSSIKDKKVNLVDFFSFVVPTMIEWIFYMGRIGLQVQQTKGSKIFFVI
jgi:hypothetical protein